MDVTMKYCGKVMEQDMVYMSLHKLVAEMHHLRLLLLAFESASG